MKLEIISRYPEQTTKPTPLLFVHGSFADARCWDQHFLPYLTQSGYEVHAVSLRGHGQSEGREWLPLWRMTDYVTDLGHTVRALSRPPVLIGHSMGGMVVQKYLETQPKVAGVVLMASVPPQGLIPSNLHMALRHPFLFQQMALFALMGPSVGSLDMMRSLLFSKDMPLEQLRQYFDLVQAESQVVSLDMMWFDPLRLKPEQVRVPILVQGAQDDVFVSPAMVRATAQFYRTQPHIFPRMAHAMMLEMNWRDVADGLRDWLARAIEVQSAAA
ncbi:MAG TPA: alpha/beta fold hydrolase [Candidatus Competibacteraceae bacterium]|mgnify:FL=1|nr:MAG: alpha/beta fold hydrolase [Candidatus Competibacteraceae bacterium]HOB60751.1 alpha/beta fold hydrolase [Candidatus Competibacteraceae bacterium]HQA24882.1 alpha/beta fold hydrolase [Candidatus Competibacteraceae bacterium]HQD55740.1 alpha/beta fold hydrolase [Candidatus Competibacteraceae bacterium]